jgi:hypothetical protein
VTGVGYSCNLSESGVFIECGDPAPLGKRVYMRLYLPHKSGHPLKIIGLVKRVAPSGSDKTGMGIQFEVAYARTREALLEFIEEILAFGQAALPERDDNYRPEQTNWQAVRLSMTVDELNQSVDFDADAGPLRRGVRIAIGALVLATLCGLVYLLRVASDATL